jgi:uncharacterized GH25 family protein
MLTPRLSIAAILLTSCVPVSDPHHEHATGTISGKVVDSTGRPVARAGVTAIYFGPAQLIPPADNHLVAGEAVTSSDGAFTITTSEHIAILAAHSKDLRMVGELKGVKQSGNIIRISHPPPPRSPHP